MPEDQISQIRPVVQELNEAIKEKDNWCTTYEVLGTDKWIQLTKDALNIYWPYSEEDAKSLEVEISIKLPRCELIDCESNKYATFEIQWQDINEITKLIDWLFVNKLNTGLDYELDVEIFET